jgi:hemolysin-activating ACP:hemolysin acyltransferase
MAKLNVQKLDALEEPVTVDQGTASERTYLKSDYLDFMWSVLLQLEGTTAWDKDPSRRGLPGTPYLDTASPNQKVTIGVGFNIEDNVDALNAVIRSLGYDPALVNVAEMAKNTTAGEKAETDESIKIIDVPQGKTLNQGERDLAVRLASASVADAIGLMMRSERHRHYSLADLEWLILPPLMLNQVMFAYARPQVPAEKAAAAAKAGWTGEMPPMPVAMVTWALVSKEVAAKLDGQKKAGVPFRLAPHEWKSGKDVRVINALGQPKAAQELLAKLKAGATSAAEDSKTPRDS